MLVDDQHKKSQRFEELNGVLIQKGYPENVINKGIKNAMLLDRETLLQPRKQSTEPVITFVTNYNPNNDPRLNSFVQTNFHNMKHAEGTSDVFKNKKLIIARSQPPNMKSLLTRAKFSSSPPNHRVYRCSERCVSCKNIKEGMEHTFRSVNQTFQVKSDFTCTTRNIIYVLICDNCQQDYIGQSSLEIRFRISVHKQQIKDESLRKLNVSKHVHSCGNSQFKIFPFYKLKTEDGMERRKKEEYFIKKFQPTLNRDL